MAKTNTQVDEPQDATTRRPSKKRATKKPVKKSTKKPVKKQRAAQTTEEAKTTTSSAPRTAKKRATKKPTKKSTKKPVKKQRATQTTEEAATASAPSTAKKRATKKPTKKSAKKPVKKQRAAQTTEEAATSSAPRTTKKRATKKPTKKSVKKPAATQARAETPPKPSEAVEQGATTEVSDQGQQKVEATAPADRAQNQVGATASSTQARQKGETPAATDQARNAEPVDQPPESAPAEEMQWGRRNRRSGPISWEGRAGVSAAVQPTRRPDVQADAPAVETPAAEPEPKTPPPNRTAQGRTRNDQNDRNAQRPSSSRNKKKPDGASRKLAEILAQSWTEDKTRRFLGEGFLGSLSAELVDDGKQTDIPDAEALKKPLEMIRKVLADECMVADDVTDLMLLDVVMNALSDRIDVCRLQAESNSLTDIDVILELRYKADRRLIEAVNALKNA